MPRIIIDSNGLAYRSLFGFGELSHNQNKTGVIFGFLSEILKLAEKFQTNQFIFCWDSRHSYRKEIEPEYKGNRGDMSELQRATIEDAHIQFDLLRNEILPAMGFKNIFLQSGYEADDLIAWIVYRCPDNYIIATSDDDLLQLLTNSLKCPVKIYNLAKKVIFTEDDFTKKYGIKPSDWSKVKAIGGCTSDNVRGIPGVGPESAIKYINGALKEGQIKQKIESEIGKIQTEHCMRLTHLPFNGDRGINIIKDRDEFYKEEKFYSFNFKDQFIEYGCRSFANEEGMNKWRKAFNLIAGR